MTEPLSSCHRIIQDVLERNRTARAVTDAALERAEELQDRFHTFITLAPELARRQADRTDAIVGMGRKLPLAGLPFAVKDLIDVRGIPTTCGGRVFAGRVGQQDATVVKKLVSLGAVCLGKLNMHECAFGFTGENPYYGNCPNPWKDGHIAGGSSSGSAVAVALDICPLTLGSDTGGSIRMPAANCGLTGMKPTYGRVSRAGVLPLAWSMDHVGPLTRSAEDNALVLRALAGQDPADPSTGKQPVPDLPEELKKSVAGLRFGIPGNWFFDDLAADVARAMEAAIAQLTALGMQRVDCELPLLDEILGAHRTIIFAEAAAYHRPYLERQAADYGDDIRRLLQTGLFLPAVDYLQAGRVRRAVRESWAKVFTEFDLLVTPTVPITAPRFDQSKAALPAGEKPLLRACLDLALPFNLTGYPAVSIPCGFSRENLPIGMQLVGRPYDEAVCLRVAHHYQQHTDWHTRRPQ